MNTQRQRLRCSWRHARAGAFVAVIVALVASIRADTLVENRRYRLTVLDDGAVRVQTAGVPEQVLQPEFAVITSDRDPGYHRNHLNYPLAPRTAIRWANRERDLEALNRWLAQPEVRAMAGAAAIEVTGNAEGERTWRYRDAAGRQTYQFSGPYARGTTEPFVAGQTTRLRAVRTSVEGGAVRWSFESQPGFRLAAELRLPAAGADLQITHTLTALATAYYSVAFTGAPLLPTEQVQPIPQEAAGRGGRQFSHVVCEGELQLPRVQIATVSWNAALVIDSREAPFRIPTIQNSRFGLMLQREPAGFRPMSLAPLLGGAESRLAAGESREFRLHFLLRPGDWKETYRGIARTYYRFRDQRDNSGPGSINAALEATLDYLADRNGRNHAMWHAEQKYYDYWTDNSGIFKPFSPLFGLSAALVTDDEDFYRRRALPQVEFTLSRRSNVFAPYEVENNGQVKSRNRELGESYLGAAQLVSLAGFFQQRTPVIRAQAEAKGFAATEVAGLLARYALTGDARDLQAARRAADGQLARRRPVGEDEYMDYLELFEATGEPSYLAAAVEGAYGVSTTLNLSPAVPEESVRVEIGGRAPVHDHSVGRHKRWGFPPPQPLVVPEQTVPAWRVALTGLQSQGYRGEFWMNHHGQFMRLAAHAQDDFLRDLARWGMVGRFGTYPGDNRSKTSLVIERRDVVERPIWALNFATVNPGHAWEFAGELLDFLISDAFDRSGRQIDFPGRPLPGSSFRVRVYGDRAGRFYDENGVRLWLPRGLAALDNRQIDYLAGYGNGKLYLALLNQSFREEDVRVTLNAERVGFVAAHLAKCWVQNRGVAPRQVEDGAVVCRVPAKGIVALAIDGVQPKLGLHAKWFDPSSNRLGPPSHAVLKGPFGQVHAMLLSPGRGLTSAYVFTDALPEAVIQAKLRYRQGGGAWAELTDAIFPYEFSPPYREGTGPLELEFSVENAQQEVQRAPLITLSP